MRKKRWEGIEKQWYNKRANRETEREKYRKLRDRDREEPWIHWVKMKWRMLPFLVLNEVENRGRQSFPHTYTHRRLSTNNLTASFFSLFPKFQRKNNQKSITATPKSIYVCYHNTPTVIAYPLQLSLSIYFHLRCPKTHKIPYPWREIFLYQ